MSITRPLGAIWTDLQHGAEVRGCSGYLREWKGIIGATAVTGLANVAVQTCDEIAN